MSSHLTTPEVPLDSLTYVTRFDPVEFKQLRKEKLVAEVNTCASFIASIVVIIGTIGAPWFVSLAAVFMLVQVIMVALGAANTRRAYKPVAKARALVLRANTLADTWAMRDEQKNAPFIVKIGRPFSLNETTTNVRLLLIEYRDSTLQPLAYHVGRTFVGSMHSPNITSVIDALELAGTVNQFYDQSASTIMSHARHGEDSKVSQTRRDHDAMAVDYEG